MRGLLTQSPDPITLQSTFLARFATFDTYYFLRITEPRFFDVLSSEMDDVIPLIAERYLTPQTALAVKTASRNLHVRITAKVLHRALASTLWRDHGDRALLPFWRGVQSLLPKWVFLKEGSKRAIMEGFTNEDDINMEPIPQHPKSPPLETLSRLLDVTRFLLRWGAKALVLDNIALKGAVAVGSVEIVNLLLDHGATLETRDDDGGGDATDDVSDNDVGPGTESESDYEDSEGDDESGDEFGEIYVARRANFNIGYDDVESEDELESDFEDSGDEYRDLLRDRRDPFRRSTLWLAIYYGHHIVAALLLDRGANINELNQIVLGDLAFHGMGEMLDTLLPWMDPTAKPWMDGAVNLNDLLLEAVSGGHIDIVRMLFDRGARMVWGVRHMLGANGKELLDLVRIYL
ncbi:hypothetical protein HK104_001398 [Borealophlyctis nickersoniae]|nr:hypothetical protein HK104_001398 [Borealophlyctis nickersoniae]